MKTGLPITVAVPKGRIMGELAPLLGRAGWPGVEALAEDRRLAIDKGPIRYLLVRPSDVATYVAEGAADLGITGKDVLMEYPGGYYELLDLGVGGCRLSVAGPDASRELWRAASEGQRPVRVATKFPGICGRLFERRSIQAAVIRLGGSVELAPLVGLSDVIVDLVASGRTLRENGLVELEELERISARLIANPSSLRLREDKLQPWLQGLEGNGRGGGGRAEETHSGSLS